MSYEVGNPNLIWLMLAIPVVLALIVYSGWAKRRAMASFGSASNPSSLIGESLAGLLLMLGMTLLVLACMDIRWGKTSREVPQKGLEVVFALDVSRSMLAQDAKPNRLIRAKQQISDMVDEMAGDRIGLVAFAGEAIQVVPLTNHYNDFRQKLETLGPDAVSRGGSQLGVAIAEAADAFISKTNEHKTIILFTDGEDQESNPIELAREMHAKNGTRVFTVGLGDIAQGARIPDGTTRRSEFVEHEGRQVWSKLNGSILREIATETKAAYIPAGTKRVNMADVYHSYVANVEKSEFETARINGFVPRFQWFAFPAFVCLFLNQWLTTRRSSVKPTVNSSANRTRVGNRTKISSRAAAVFIALMPGVLSAQTSDGSTASTINAANQLVRENKLQEAIESLNQIDDSPDSKHRDELNYSLATAHFRNADLDSAATLFEQSAKSTNTKIASDSRYNLGNCHYARALPLAEQQPDAAIAELETAITHYRSALRLNRQRSDARENLERAGKLIKQLKNQQENNQQQEQPQDQKSNEEQQQKDQSDQNKSGQQQNADDSQGDQDQQSEPDSNSDEQENSTEGQNEESQNGDSSQQGEGDPDEQGESGQNQPTGDQNESTDPNSQQQSQSADSQSGKDGEQKEDGDTQTQGEQSTEEKQPPEGELSAANQSAGKTDDTSSANSKAARIGNDESGLMTKQEALKLLQAVRDRDMIRRLKQQQQQRQRRVRVDRDW